MELFQIDDDGRLFISAAIHEWAPIAARGIQVVVDLDGALDSCVPETANHCLYVYFPFADDDEALPDLSKLSAIARLSAQLIRDEQRVLVHCGMGFNRSALVAGLILTELGMTGSAAVARLRERRPGALFNDLFADYLSVID